MAYQAQQLVALALSICNLPTGRASQVGQMLNIILANHAQTIDEDVIRKTTTLNIGPQATIPYWNALPSDYLRFYDVFYYVNGEPFYLRQMELTEFDQSYVGSGISEYPDSFTTDVSQSPVVMAFYPPPSVPLAVTVRYRPQTSDITTPETSTTIPWFPNQLTLLEELCEKAMWLSDDSRSEMFRRNVKEDLNRYMAISDDKEGYSMTVKLDPKTFRSSNKLPPSKVTGW